MLGMESVWLLEILAEPCLLGWEREGETGQRGSEHDGDSSPMKASSVHHSPSSGLTVATLCLLVLLWKRRHVTDVLWATVTLVGALEFLRSYW